MFAFQQHPFWLFHLFVYVVCNVVMVRSIDFNAPAQCEQGNLHSSRKWHGAGNRCYYIGDSFGSYTTMERAKRFCRSRGADLMLPDSEREFKYLEAWKSFTREGTSEPTKKCAVMSIKSGFEMRKRKWFQYDCNYTFGITFICEKPAIGAAAIVDYSEKANCSGQEDWYGVGDTCYFYDPLQSRSGTTFAEAREKCNALGADVMFPNSEDEHIFLIWYMETLEIWPKKMWLGIKRPDDDVTWEDLRKDLSFQAWKDQQRNQGDKCASLEIIYELWTISKHWVYQACSSRLRYICEKPAMLT
ncbi:unnamed protein product [Owenia fusiformis]|uniref:Uncharacterized protein n=1 Tax=Owenia fusiformis TaxID=6347 RepID=A0A8J1XV72_OWEFU|nr:unnamed protein product [Owenia fusiformis]